MSVSNISISFSRNSIRQLESQIVFRHLQIIFQYNGILFHFIEILRVFFLVFFFIDKINATNDT